LKAYGHNQCCHLCRASKLGLMAYFDHRDTAPWRASAVVPYDHYVAACVEAGFRIPFLDIPGFKHTLIAIDDMHANDQGFCLRATGSILLWLAQNFTFGDGALRLRLQRAFIKYCEWCTHTKQESRCVAFTPENLHASGDNSKFVFLTAKAADARHFAAFIYDCVLSVGGHGVQWDMIVALSWGLRTYYSIEYGAPRWLTDRSHKWFTSRQILKGGACGGVCM
jgi:hypothetical protein